MFGLALFLQQIIINAMKNDVKCVDDDDDNDEGKPAHCCHSAARTDNNGWTNENAQKHPLFDKREWVYREYRSLADWLWSRLSLSLCVPSTMKTNKNEIKLLPFLFSLAFGIYALHTSAEMTIRTKETIDEKSQNA